jgi:DNA-directed RNA polymerase specialized sigma24 family protein
MSVLDDARATPSGQHHPPGDRELAVWFYEIACGDRVAFARLSDALSGETRHLASAAFSDGRSADAVVATTFLQVWRLAPANNPASVRAWVAGIAASLIASRQDSPRQSPSKQHAAHWQAPWAAFSSTYDDTMAAVLASRLNRRGRRVPTESR